MKNFNLCLIALIFGSFLFINNSCHANTISSIVHYPLSQIETEPGDVVDPDWKILIGHLTGNTVFRDQKMF